MSAVFDNIPLTALAIKQDNYDWGFLAFAVGAVIPVVPYLVGASALWPALAVTMVALFACGALVTRFTVQPWWYGGLRQMSLGAAAAGLTYLVGDLVGGAGLG